MKKLLVLGLVLLVLTACSIPNLARSGSMSISAPRGLAGTEDTMRVSLTRNGIAYPLNGSTGVLESSIGANIQIDNLIPGPNYQISLSFGKKVGQTLVVSNYALSGLFTVTEGTNTTQNLTLVSAPALQYLTTSGLPASVARLRNGSNPTLAVLDGQTLYDAVPAFSTAASTPAMFSLGPATAYAVPANINSLSAGIATAGATTDELWLNTASGIYHNSGASYTGVVMNIDTNVTLSRGMNLSTGMAAVYSGSGVHVGGAFTIGTLQASDWASFSTSIGTYPQFQSAAAQITRTLISDIAVTDTSNGFYYLATPAGTLIGNLAVKDLISNGTLSSNPNLINSHILKIGDGSIGINKVATAQSMVFAAADKGLYYSPIDANGVPTEPTGVIATSSIVSGTENLQIVSVDTVYVGGAYFTAAVTSTNDVLIITGTTPAITQTLVRGAGIPANAKATLSWDTIMATNNIYLVLAGTNGAVFYLIATLSLG